MAVSWSRMQRERVVDALGQYGVESAQCERAASRILPPAREVHPAAVARVCKPAFGIFVCPKRKWFHHVNVFVAKHYVDALSGPDGQEENDYLDCHWRDRAAFIWQDLTDDALEELAGWTLQNS